MFAVFVFWGDADANAVVDADTGADNGADANTNANVDDGFNDDADLQFQSRNFN